MFLRKALGISFLSAVADRFGLWGDFSRFVAYTGKLNSFAPTAVIPALARAATFAEVLVGSGTRLGFFTRVAALLSGLMLLLFALTMTFTPHHEDDPTFEGSPSNCLRIRRNR